MKMVLYDVFDPPQRLYFTQKIRRILIVSIVADSSVYRDRSVKPVPAPADMHIDQVVSCPCIDFEQLGKLAPVNLHPILCDAPQNLSRPMHVHIP